MQTAKLAFRNLLRNRRRTLSTLGAIVVGAVGILLFGGYNRSIEYSLQTAFVRDIGHLQIQHEDYLRNGMGNPAEYSIRDYQKIMDTIAHDPVLASMTKVSTPVLLVSGIAGKYSTGVAHPALIYGCDEAGRAQLDRWDEYRLGAQLKTRKTLDKNPDSALIGAGLARLLQLGEFVNDPQYGSSTKQSDKVSESIPDDIRVLAQAAQQARPPDKGTRIELLAASTGGVPNIVRVQVDGVAPQAARELDDSFVGIHLQRAQQLLFGQDTPGVTAIILQLHKTAQLEAARSRLQHVLATSHVGERLAIYDFAQLQPTYGQVLGMFSDLFDFLLALILGIALFTVSNAMGVAVLERTVEIGTLRAVGLKRWDIQRLFLNEGVLLGVIGSVIGVAAALILANVINVSGLTWQPPGVIAPVPLRIAVWGEWWMIARVVGILLAATVFSSWWPARRAANVSVVEALRHR
ncbi:ABC transporter permease [Paraburkholderia dinghuensis]|uniref:ABC transporter permease n=1 Tax=Paraburkholderia dinghuensis TaxID=2305225 RepID=A0A3N6N1E1_9BURK|nr:FtsX-like permease family protein [Paraburkholderia dinghuensis]RQH09984.1 ABC transporter permease [Paraburkholderia dinghuensis]